MPDDSGDNKPSTGGRLFKWGFYTVFFGTVVLTVIAGILYNSGHKEVVERFLGPTAMLLIGLIFAVSVAWSTIVYGCAYVIYFGQVSRTTKPGVYWSVIGVVFLVGLAIAIVGGYLLWKGISATHLLGSAS